MSIEGQALCFMAGAGSIFAGNKLLTTPNPEMFKDLEMFHLLGLTPTEPYAKHEKPAVSEKEEVPETEDKKHKWSRPKHRIEANVKYTKLGKQRRKAQQNTDAEKELKESKAQS